MTPPFFHTAAARRHGLVAVIQTAGQPDRRLDHEFSYCTTAGTLTVNFDSAGKVRRESAA